MIGANVAEGLPSSGSGMMAALGLVPLPSPTSPRGGGGGDDGGRGGGEAEGGGGGGLNPGNVTEFDIHGPRIEMHM